MENQYFVFIYAKSGKIQVLSCEDAKLNHKQLIAEGYIHTATLDPCLFIQYLHNGSSCIFDDVKSLSNEERNF